MKLLQNFATAPPWGFHYVLVPSETLRIAQRTAFCNMGRVTILKCLQSLNLSLGSCAENDRNVWVMTGRINDLDSNDLFCRDKRLFQAKRALRASITRSALTTSAVWSCRINFGSRWSPRYFFFTLFKSKLLLGTSIEDLENSTAARVNLHFFELRDQAEFFRR